MDGLAKQAFQLKTGYPLPQHEPVAKGIRWKSLRAWREMGIIAAIDETLAQTVLDGVDVDEDVAAFLAYLSLASRQGHLCVGIDQGRLIPEPNQLCREPCHYLSSEPWTATDLTEFTSAVSRGTVSIPEHLFDSSDALLASRRSEEVQLFSFRRHHHIEQSCLVELRRLLDSSPEKLTDASAWNHVLESSRQANELLLEQAQGLLNAGSHTVTIITGGPGTGKSYTASQIVKSLIELGASDDSGLRIALTAPTGKAVANLQTYLEASLGDTFNTYHERGLIGLSTLHSLLKLGRQSSRRQIAAMSLPWDVILIDESSMIDAAVMTTLLRAIKTGTRLILLGDPAQLPPVEMGSIFTDIVERLSTDPRFEKHIVRLTQCLRTELAEILTLAKAVTDGDAALVSSSFSCSAAHLSYQTLPGKPAAGHRELIETVLDTLRFPEEEPENFDAIFAAFNTLKVLSPLRRGPWGVDTLNAVFAERIVSGSRDRTLYLPILVTKNDYRLKLFNGQLGVLVKRRSSSRTDDEAIFPNPSGGYRAIPGSLLPPTEYAFCLSIHKSQGSEFDQILVVLPEGSEVFGKEILYTAITRAKKHVTLWSQKETLAQTVTQSSRRWSMIRWETAAKLKH